MGYLKTVLTYRVPAEAEVDKSLLESNGIAVHLLNDRSPPGDIVFPLPIELQVPEEQFPQAVEILREFNPGRFGSPERVRQLDLELRRKAGRFLAGGCVASLAAWVGIPLLVSSDMFDWRLVGALGAFFVGGFVALKLLKDKGA